jgi:hypothetical protein
MFNICLLNLHSRTFLPKSESLDPPRVVAPVLFCAECAEGIRTRKKIPKISNVELKCAAEAGNG